MMTTSSDAIVINNNPEICRKTASTDILIMVSTISLL